MRSRSTAAFIPALENLERIYAARGPNRELVDVMTRKVPALTDKHDIAQTKLRIASLYETSLNDPVRAAQVYREVVDIDAANLAGLRGLARVYEVLDQWPDLVKVLESAARRGPDRA